MSSFTGQVKLSIWSDPCIRRGTKLSRLFLGVYADPFLSTGSATTYDLTQSLARQPHALCINPSQPSPAEAIPVLLSLRGHPMEPSLASDPSYASDIIHLSLLQQRPSPSSLASDPSYASVRVHLSLLQLTETTLVLRLASDPLHQSESVSAFSNRGHPSPL